MVDLEELRRLNEARTQGEWRWKVGPLDRGASKGKLVHRSLWTGVTVSGSILHANWNEFDGGVWDTWLGIKDNDAAFIAAIANATPALLEERDRLREALGKIADRLVCTQGRGATDPDFGCCYCPNCDRSLDDARDIARTALGSAP